MSDFFQEPDDIVQKALDDSVEVPSVVRAECPQCGTDYGYVIVGTTIGCGNCSFLFVVGEDGDVDQGNDDGSEGDASEGVAGTDPGSV